MTILVVLLALSALTQAEINLNAKDRRTFFKVPGVEKMKPNHTLRIFGGENVVPHSIPYQVALRLQKNGGSGICSGSLISTSFVLTAAHCIANATEAVAILGAHKYKEVEDSQVRLGAKRFIIHPDYKNDNSGLNDIGLIELNETVTLNDNIQLSNLPTQADVNNTYEHTIGTVSGWGYYAIDQGTSDELRSLRAQIMSNAECVIEAHKNIPSSLVCTNGDTNVGICGGDSGAPLVVGNQQIGVASLATANCDLGLPSIYTRITSFLDFIASEVK